MPKKYRWWWFLLQDINWNVMYSIDHFVEQSCCLWCSCIWLPVQVIKGLWLGPRSMLWWKWKPAFCFATLKICMWSSLLCFWLLIEPLHILDLVAGGSRTKQKKLYYQLDLTAINHWHQSYRCGIRTTLARSHYTYPMPNTKRILLSVAMYIIL